jgi:Zinc finger, C3HC4 type (RING finger)
VLHTVDLTQEELELLRGDERCGLWWWEWLLIAIFAIYVPLAACSLFFLVPAFRNTNKMTEPPTTGQSWCFAFAVLVPVIGWAVAVFLWWTTRAHSRERRKAMAEIEVADRERKEAESQAKQERQGKKKKKKPSQQKRSTRKIEKEPSPSSSETPSIEVEITSSDSTSSDSTAESDTSATTTTASLTSVTADESADSCLVCHSNSPMELLAPCGHLGVCKRCLKRITTCPTCDTPVTGTIKPF